MTGFKKCFHQFKKEDRIVSFLVYIVMWLYRQMKRAWGFKDEGELANVSISGFPSLVHIPL
jgi:hypothetical protein